MLCVALWEVSASLSTLGHKITPRVGREAACGVIILLSLLHPSQKVACSAQEYWGQAVRVQSPEGHSSPLHLPIPCPLPWTSSNHLFRTSMGTMEGAHGFGKHVMRGKSPCIVATLKVL